MSITIPCWDGSAPTSTGCTPCPGGSVSLGGGCVFIDIWDFPPNPVPIDPVVSY